MDVQQNVQTDSVIKAFLRSEPGSLLIPRVNGKPVLWSELIKLILDDSHYLKFDAYGRPFDSSELKPNAPCELISGKSYVYKPVDLELFRKNIVSIQMNFLVNLWNLARFKPAFVQSYLALSNDAFQMLVETEMSAFVEVTNVIFFPRFITYDTGRRGSKVYAWGYEILADLLEGFIPRVTLRRIRIMVLKKSEVSQLDSLAKAIRLLEYDANKYTITHLYGRKVADRLEYRKGVNTRSGVGSWLGEKSAMLLSNVVVNNAIHIFGYEPQNPTESTKEMDFNALVDLLIQTGYSPEYYPLQVNRIVQVLNGMSEADYKDYCLVCKKPFIHAPDKYDSCPTCSAKKCKVAIMRYSQPVVPFE